MDRNVTESSRSCWDISGVEWVWVSGAVCKKKGCQCHWNEHGRRKFGCSHSGPDIRILNVIPEKPAKPRMLCLPLTSGSRTLLREWLCWAGLGITNRAAEPGLIPHKSTNLRQNCSSTLVLPSSLQGLTFSSGDTKVGELMGLRSQQVPEVWQPFHLSNMGISSLHRVINILNS